MNIFITLLENVNKLSRTSVGSVSLTFESSLLVAVGG
jgi:hypothetical protein